MNHQNHSCMRDEQRDVRPNEQKTLLFSPCETAPQANQANNPVARRTKRVKALTLSSSHPPVPPQPTHTPTSHPLFFSTHNSTPTFPPHSHYLAAAKCVGGAEYMMAD